MRTPPWLMAGALLFWGWQTGLLIWALPLAAVLEGARWTQTRWELSNIDLNRIADLCLALFLGVALLLYSTGQDRLVFIFKLVQWLPFSFFPIMVAQAYGNREQMPLSVFWWLLRRAPHRPAARKAYNISHCYFAACLLAASASMQPNSFFYLGMAVLVALALSSARPRRISLSAWVTLLLLVATAGQFSHRELKRAQNAVEIALGGWIADLFGPPQDTFRERQTRIGASGSIPQSGRIALRLHAEPGGFVPPLLREATWDAYRKGTWSASNNDFTVANPGASDTVKLLPTNKLSSEVEIARYYDSREVVLPLPHGTFEITDVPAEVGTNRLGAVRVREAPGLMMIHALFAPGKTIDAPPTDRDLVVPEAEEPALAKVAHKLKLDQMSDRQKIRAIERFFQRDFDYSLNPPRDPARGNPLAYFLLDSHTGHCEYFATATVLLLRQVGISARYVTGYAVPETARHGDTYLVRERDAHAWALAYHQDTGLWEQVDTTPGDWDKAKGAQPPWWEPASDALSNLYFQFSKWRWSKTSYARYTSWLLAPLILGLMARIALTQRRQRPSDGADASRRAPWPGLDSELYLINQRLAAAQLSRLPNEPLQSWQERLELALPDAARLRRIFLLHRSLRFDPRGLERDDRELLRSEAQRWMADFKERMTAELQAAPGPQ